MSRRVDPKTVKVGDRVRVGRESDEFGSPLHGIKFGAVCTVKCIESGDLHVEGPMDEGQGWTYRQWVAISSCKVAK